MKNKVFVIDPNRCLVAQCSQALHEGTVDTLTLRNILEAHCLGSRICYITHTYQSGPVLLSYPPPLLVVAGIERALGIYSAQAIATGRISAEQWAQASPDVESVTTKHLNAETKFVYFLGYLDEKSKRYYAMMAIIGFEHLMNAIVKQKTALARKNKTASEDSSEDNSVKPVMLMSSQARQYRTNLNWRAFHGNGNEGDKDFANFGGRDGNSGDMSHAND